MVGFVLLGCKDDPTPDDNINVDSDWSKPFEEFEPLGDDPVIYNPVGIGVSVPSTYSGEIGYGYDVLEGDYYNVEDVKTRSIFDIDKMIQDGLILTDQAGYTENYTTTDAGNKSASEYAKSLSASLGVEYNAIFFSAGLQVDFSASGKITSNTSFAKFNSYIQTQMDKLKSTGLSCKILWENMCIMTLLEPSY